MYIFTFRFTILLVLSGSLVICPSSGYTYSLTRILRKFHHSLTIFQTKMKICVIIILKKLPKQGGSFRFTNLALCDDISFFCSFPLLLAHRIFQSSSFLLPRWQRGRSFWPSQRGGSWSGPEANFGEDTDSELANLIGLRERLGNEVAMREMLGKRSAPASAEDKVVFEQPKLLLL